MVRERIWMGLKAARERENKTSYAECRNILQGSGFNSPAPGAGQHLCLRAITVRRRDRFWGCSRPFSRAAENVSFGRFRTVAEN